MNRGSTGKNQGSTGDDRNEPGTNGNNRGSTGKVLKGRTGNDRRPRQQPGWHRDNRDETAAPPGPIQTPAELRQRPGRRCCPGECRQCPGIATVHR
ncbi:hypothetical protein DPMN_020221 [Dreissena polymorpha]|uniref:Uncharacterized protein n=1 Tax=Dreissena polymorpha TaxID=45954 RepID=A0A9D4NJZ7_DREPO|nr:hypothetical protein DPMN_020221 [Dreissena polymorpha]